MDSNVKEKEYKKKAFVDCFSSLLFDLQSNPAVLALSSNIFTFLKYLQLIGASFYPCYDTFWRRNGDRPLYLTFFSAFCRVIPYELSIVWHQRFATALFLLCLIAWIASLSIIMSYRFFWNSSKSRLSSIIHLPIFMFRLIHFPSISILSYFIVNSLVDSSVIGSIFLTIITFVLSSIGDIYGIWILHGFPSFMKSLGSKWTLSTMWGYHASSVSIIVVNEIIGSITNREAKFSLYTFLIVSLIIVIYYDYYTVNRVTMESNIIGIYLMSFIMVLQIIFISLDLLNQNPNLFLPISMVVLIPLYMITSVFVTKRIQSLKRIIIDFIDNDSINYLLNYPDYVLVSAMGHAQLEMGKNTKALDWTSEQFPQSFFLLCHNLKHKISILHQKDSIPMLCSRMKQIEGLALIQKVIIQIFGTLTTPNEYEMSIICHNSISHYFFKLSQFWREVLFGRRDKLFDIGIQINEVYSSIKSNFTLFNLDSAGVSSEYHRFSMISNEYFEENELNMDFRDFRSIFFSLSNPTNNENNSNKKKSSQAAALEAHEKIYRGKSDFYRRMALFIPFFLLLVAFVFIIFEINQLFLRMNLYIEAIECYSKIIIYLAGSSFLYPFIPLSSGINLSGINLSIVNKDLFPSFLQNPRSDLAFLCNRIRRTSSKFSMVLSQLSDIENISYLSNRFFRTDNIYSDGIIGLDLSFFSYLQFYSVRLPEVSMRTNEEILQMIGNYNYSIFLNNTMKNIVSISENYMPFTEIIRTSFLSLAKLYMKRIIIMLFITFLISISSLIIFMRFYRMTLNDFFQTLFFLPKTDVNKLISELQKSIYVQNYFEDFCLQYSKENNSQLLFSLENEHKSFLSIGLRIVPHILVAIIVLTITGLFMTTTTVRSLVNLSSVSKATEFSTILPFELFRVGQGSVEFFLITLYNITMSYGSLHDLRQDLVDNVNRVTDLKQKLYNTINVLTDSSFNLSVFFDVISSADRIPLLGHISNYATSVLQLIIDIYDTKFTSYSSVQASIAGLLFTIDHIYPIVLDSVFNNTLLLVQNTYGTFLRYCQAFAFYYIVAIITSCIIIRSIPPLVFLTHSILTTIPPESFHFFKQYIYPTSFNAMKKENFELCMDIFSEVSVIDSLSASILVLDKDQNIFIQSTGFMTMFQIETNDQIESNFINFMQKYEIGSIPQFPKKGANFIDFYEAVLPDSSTLPIKLLIVGIQPFTVVDKTMSHAILFYDNSPNMVLSKELTMLTNDYFSLEGLYLPDSLLNSVVDGTIHTGITFVARGVVTSFLVTGFQSYTEPYEFQKLFKESLDKFTELTFYGRSMNSFHIITDNFFQTKSADYECLLHIQFVFELMKNTIEFRNKTGIRIYSLVHSANFLGEVIEIDIPVFGIQSKDFPFPFIDVSLCLPNEVSITRPVYEIIYDYGFSIHFDNEIQHFDSSKTYIHIIELDYSISFPTNRIN